MHYYFIITNTIYMVNAAAGGGDSGRHVALPTVHQHSYSRSDQHISIVIMCQNRLDSYIERK